MSSPILRKVSRGLGGLGGANGLEKFIDQHAATLQQVAQELDGFEGGTANADMANATLDQMRGYARMQSMGLGGLGNSGVQGQMQGMCSGGNNGSGFDPLAQNRCSGSGGRSSTLSGADLELQTMAEAGGAGGYFEDRVFALMIKIVEDFQKKIEERLQKLQAEAKKAEQEGGKGGGGEGGGDKGGESRNIEFEKIKFDMQKLSQMQQALSNILNTMDELAKSAIRHIKAG
jgi:hypothetical protein